MNLYFEKYIDKLFLKKSKNLQIMFEKKILIVLFLIFPILKAEMRHHSQIDDFGSNCLIHNKWFKFEYLYSNNETRKTSYQLTDQLIPSNRVNDFKMITWSLIDTGNNSGQFYMKSTYFDDYLCAITKFADIFRSKRVVMKYKMKSNSIPSDNCKWMIKRVNSTTSYNMYLIINVLFNQHLYASFDSYLFKKKTHQAEIYLNSRKNINSENFKWVIDCQTGDYLWI